MTRIDDHLWAELVRRPEAPRALAARQPRPRARTWTEDARADGDIRGPSRGRPGILAAWPRGTSVVALLATAGAVLAGAVAALLLFTAGGSPSVAFAGWSASPTPAPASQIAAAEAQCLARAPEYLKRAERDDERPLERASAFKALPAFEAAEWPTVLKDTRGPYTSLIRESSGGQAVLICNSGPTNRLGNGWILLEPPKPSAGEVRLTSEGGYYDTTAKEWVGEVEGRAGTGVTRVTVVLEDGMHVEATTSNGWFLAWWPGHQQAPSAEVATASGVTSQKLQFDD